MCKRRRRRRWNSRWPSRPGGRGRGLALALLALALGLSVLGSLGQPPAARAQAPATNPFTPGLPVAPAPTPTVSTATTTATTTSTGGGGLSSGSAAAIGIGAFVLLGGISLFIWYDARRRAPVRRRAAVATTDGGSRPGSRQRVKSRRLSPAERRRRKRGRAR